MSALRVLAGVPAGGQFATSSRAEPSVRLAPAPTERHFVALTDWEPDYDYPYPQANNLESVALVADAVEGGATTPDAIAEALDLSTRQGAYYANAAAYMGLIEADRGEHCTSYSLTGLGETFTVSDADDRAEMMAQMVGSLDDAALVAADGAEVLKAQLERDGLAPETAQRRAECMKSWATATDDRTGLSRAIASESDATRNRIAGAAQTARTQREAARKAAVPEPTYNLCPSCFIAMPATNVCDDCA